MPCFLFVTFTLLKKGIKCFTFILFLVTILLSFSSKSFIDVANADESEQQEESSDKTSDKKEDLNSEKSGT